MEEKQKTTLQRIMFAWVEESMAATSPLRAVLTDFTRIEGVEGVAVISKDGFVVDYILPGGGGIDLEALAAMITTVYGAASRLGEELKLGDIDNLIIEFRGHYVLFQDLGPALFTLLATKGAILGRLRYEMRRQRDRIKAAL